MVVQFGPEEEEPVIRATRAEHEHVAATVRQSTRGPRQRTGSSERAQLRTRAATVIAADFLPEIQDGPGKEVVHNSLMVASRWPIPLADVSASIQRYLNQEQLLARYGLPIPSIPVAGGPPLPAAILPAAPMASTPPDWSESDLNVIQRGRDQLDSSLQRAGRATENLTPSAARWAVRERLGQFLEARLVAIEEGAGLLRRLIGVVRGRPPTGQPGSPGLPFEVATRASGMRIHWSPAYFFESEHVFGSNLSTPVDDSLQPGRYIFGAIGPQHELTWEYDAEYNLPHAKRASMVTV